MSSTLAGNSNLALGIVGGKPTPNLYTANGVVMRLIPHECIPRTSRDDNVTPAREIFVDADKDKSGSLDFNEFAAMDCNKGLSRTELRLIFDRLDVNKDGTLDVGEFERYRAHTSSVGGSKAVGGPARSSASGTTISRQGGQGLTTPRQCRQGVTTPLQAPGNGEVSASKRMFFDADKDVADGRRFSAKFCSPQFQHVGSENQGFVLRKFSPPKKVSGLQGRGYVLLRFLAE